MKRTPLRRKTPLRAPSRPMKRAGRIKRKTRLQAKGGARFKGLRDKEYREWIRGQRCIVVNYAQLWPEGIPRYCYLVEPDHVKTRGAGGGDRGNLVPCCAIHHRERHTIGIRSFEEKYGFKLAAIAAELAQRYERERTA